MGDEPNKRPKPFHTHPVVEFYAFREALKFLSYEGLENIWRRHAAVHEYTVTKLESELPQLQYFVQNESDRLISYFVMKIPDNLQVRDIIDYMLEK